MTDDTEVRHDGMTRRGVLALSAAVGATTVLAACGGESTETVESAESSKNGGESKSSGDGSNGSATLTKAADVPVGSGVILEEAKIVVTQPSAGNYKAFSGICTHQSCLVSSVNEKTINCQCHGSAFKISDGSVVNGPAERPLREIKVKVEGESVVRA